MARFGYGPFWSWEETSSSQRKLQNDKISTADQQINSAFNGFSHIYLPLSFIEVIKCTGEFLPHQRKFVNDIHCRWKKGEGPIRPLESLKAQVAKLFE